jgi:hypothetical protein
MKNTISILIILLTSFGCATQNNPSNIPMLQSSSNFTARQVVDCILAHYQGREFWVEDKTPSPFGPITLELYASERATLAVVTGHPGGSTTQYINVRHHNYKNIPRPDTFDNAVNKCQSSS